jgi:hypothetical protein
MSFRLEVTETFSISGRGNVVVGEVEGSAVEVGEQVRMRFATGTERPVIVTEILVQGRSVPRAEPGEKAGLLLRGIRRPPVGTVLESLDASPPEASTTLDTVKLSDRTTELPLLLLPLRLETSFEGRHLRIRAYPDQVHVDSFDPRLTEDEVAAGRAYLGARGAGRPSADAFADLETTLGPIRARLVADQADSGGEAALRAESDGGLNRRAVARGLPTKLIAHGFAGGREFTAEGREIPPEVPVAPAAGDSAVPGGGGPLDWMVDFEKAEAIGLALTLELDADAARQGLDWLYIFGVDASSSGERTFADLIQAHAGSDGVATMDPLTPTKGSPRNPPVWSDKTAQPDGYRRLLRDLGLRDELSLSRPAQPDPGALVRSLAFIVWEAALRPTLLQFYAAGSDTLARAREVFVEHIYPFGPYPTLQIGSQPYSIAPVAAVETGGRGDTLLGRLGDAIRGAMPAVVEGAGISRSRAGDPAGYHRMVDTLLRHPIGQHWRLRTLTVAEAYLTSVARAAGSSEAIEAAQALMTALTQGRQLLRDLDLPVDGDARVHTAFGDLATPSVCGPLVAVGAAEDRTERQLADPGLRDLISTEGFWTQRVEGASVDKPYYEGEEPGAEPLLRLFTENAVLQVLGDLAVAEGLATGRDAELVAEGILEGGVATIPAEGWHLRSRLAAGVEAELGGASLAHIASRFRPATPDGRDLQAHLSELLAAISAVNDSTAGGTHAAFAALLDSLATRADVWLVAEAEAALEAERRAGRRGVTLGGWSVLEEVRPATSPMPTRHMTAPSVELSTTLGLIERARRGLASSGIDGVIRAELTGSRVAEAREILDLLRQGRGIDAALSRRVADKLSTAGRGALMEPIVSALPIEGGALGGFECDGLAFLERPNFGGIPEIGDAERQLLTRIQLDLRAAMETLGELQLVEGASALSQRRVDAAQATLAGLSAGAPPPTDMSVLTPSSTGATLDFAVAACVGFDDAAVDTQDLRALMSPRLAILAARLLGPIQGSLASGSSAPVPLRDLGLSALSLAHLAASGGDPADRLAIWARAAGKLAEDAEPDLDDPARSTLWAAARLAATLAEARGLAPDDFPAEAGLSLDAVAMAEARRLAEAALTQRLADLPSADNATLGNAAELFAAGLIPAPELALVDDAGAAITARLERASVAADDLAALSELLKDMPAMPVCRCSDVRAWQDGPLLQGASKPELFLWLEDSQVVRSRLAPLADLLLGAEQGPLVARAVQWPVAMRPSAQQQVDWIGAQLREDDVYAGRSSFVVLGTDLGDGSAFSGLFIDGWQEVVPDEACTAGIVVDTATPPARPPQLMVIAVPDGSGSAWNARSVLETLEATVAIGQMRTIGLGSLPEETPANGVFGRLGQILPVGAVKATDTALARANCPPVEEG